MAKQEDQEIKLAFLHQAITWPGVAGSEKTISAAKIKGLKMYLVGEGLVLECKGKKSLVPYANIVNCVYAG